MFKRLVQLFLLLLLAAVGVLVWFAWYVSTPARSRGRGGTSSYPVAGSLVMEPVEAVSADGTAIEGYLVRPGRPEALSPRQSRVRDTLKLRGRMPHLEAKPELVVIATSWDQGVKGSLPLAEGLTGAGYTCLVWNPRGKNNTRQFCTYGLREYADVTALLDAVSRKQGGLPPVAAVGQGFGAAVLLKAASEDPASAAWSAWTAFLP
ncbi:MAG: alpha/beta hydrolase family protein [Akkermansia sp.]